MSAPGLELILSPCGARLDKNGESELKDSLTIAPPASEILGKNDILIVIGEEKNIEKFKSS